MSDEYVPEPPPEIFADRGGASPRLRPRYLGDGVYASHDGWQIWLTIGNHRNGRLIALDDAVMKSLVAYHAEISARALAEQLTPDPNTIGEGEV